MPSLNPQQSVLQKPVGGRFVFVSLLLALLANLLPWTGTVILLWPDLVAMVLLYWVFHQPRRTGLMLPWTFGLLMDIADGVLLGQHALAYVIMCYVAYTLHRRVQMFDAWQQALYVFGLLILSLSIMLMVRSAFGAPSPGILYFLGSGVAAVLWPMFSLLMHVVQRGKFKPEGSFPSNQR